MFIPSSVGSPIPVNYASMNNKDERYNLKVKTIETDIKKWME